MFFEFGRISVSAACTSRYTTRIVSMSIIGISVSGPWPPPPLPWREWRRIPVRIMSAHLPVQSAGRAFRASTLPPTDRLADARRVHDLHDRVVVDVLGDQQRRVVHVGHLTLSASRYSDSCTTSWPVARSEWFRARPGCGPRPRLRRLAAGSARVRSPAPSMRPATPGPGRFTSSTLVFENTAVKIRKNVRMTITSSIGTMFRSLRPR